MLTPTLRRTAAITGSLFATGAVLLTSAVSANAAAPGYTSVATGQAAVIKIASQPAYASPVITAKNKGGAPVVKSGATVPAADQTLLHAGAFATAAIATKDGKSIGCSGVVKPGGTVQIGDDGVTCTGSDPNGTGVTLDLGSALGTALPVGIGSINLTANAITSFASANGNGGTHGLAKFLNPHLDICVGVTLAGSCTGLPLSLPITFKGTPNEDLLPVVLTALTQSSQLGALGSTLAHALKPVVSLRGNVQVVNKGAIKVTGLKATILGGQAATLNLAIATAGPNHI